MPASVIPTIANSGAQAGTDDEEGVFIKTIGRTPMVDVLELAGSSAEIEDAAFIKPRADISVSGVRTGDTGLGASTVGGTLALVNSFPDAGVSGGQIRVLTIPMTAQAENWWDFGLTARQYPSIAA